MSTGKNWRRAHIQTDRPGWLGLPELVLVESVGVGEGVHPGSRCRCVARISPTCSRFPGVRLPWLSS